MVSEKGQKKKGIQSRRNIYIYNYIATIKINLVYLIGKEDRIQSNWNVKVI